MKLHTFRRYWLKPIGAVAILTLIAASIFSYTIIVPQQASFALSAQLLTGNETHNRDTSVDQLSVAQLKQELAHQKGSWYASAERPDVGGYSGRLSAAGRTTYIRHSFIAWDEDWKLAQELVTDQRLGTTPLITVEPKGEPDGSKLLTDISAGKYDDRLKHLFDIVRLAHTSVYIRFAHEMDLPDLYAWAQQDPTRYIDAYRHVVDLGHQHASNTQWMWSPAGAEGADVYYPGNDYVDVVGTTILYDRYWSGTYQPSFNELQQNRVWLQSFHKPVWIAEFGVGNTDPTYQSQLISEAVTQFRADGYSALLYMDINDTYLPTIDYHVSDSALLRSAFSMPLPPAVFSKPKISTTTAQLSSRPRPLAVLTKKH